MHAANFDATHVSSIGYVHHCHSVRENDFRLYMCMLVDYVTIKRVCRPRIPARKFLQNVFSRMQRSQTPFELRPSSSNCHFHFVFLDSPHKSHVCVGKFSREFNDIVWNKPPKHAFLSHRTLAPPWGLSPDPTPGALKVFRELECTARK